MTKISPSILAGDFANISQTIKNAQSWGADYIHCDVMDGNYVPNITFGQQMIKSISKLTTLPLDVHLMVQNPEVCAVSFVEAGASIVTFHSETCNHPHRLLGEILKAGAKAGIVLNPGISPKSIEYLLPLCNIVLLMSVNPGAGGQKFIEQTTQKAKELVMIREKNNLDFEIEIDGGVDENNAQRIVKAGVDVLVAGSSIFGAKEPEKYLAKLKSFEK